MPTKIVKQNVPVQEFRMSANDVFCFQIVQVPFRVGRDRAWDSEASHFLVKVWRKYFPKEQYLFYYSQGSAHKNVPHPRDIFRSLLEDANLANQSYAEFISEFGEENQHNWHIYMQCTRAAIWFSKSRVSARQINEWIELFREAEEAGIEFDYQNFA